MMTILEDAEARESIYPVSLEFYHEAIRLGLIQEEVELLDGVLFKKMAKSPLHEWLVDLLWNRLQSFCPEFCFIGKERPISCGNSEPEPDLAMFHGLPGDFRDHHPTTAELVIEIAINTLRRDLSKAAIYAEAGVKEYWLIEPEARQITLFTQPEGRAYACSNIFPAGSTVTSTVLTGFELELGSLLK